jgi:hypothetical protein
MKIITSITPRKNKILKFFALFIYNIKNIVKVCYKINFFFFETKKVLFLLKKNKFIQKFWYTLCILKSKNNYILKIKYNLNYILFFNFKLIGNNILKFFNKNLWLIYFYYLNLIKFKSFFYKNNRIFYKNNRIKKGYRKFSILIKFSFFFFNYFFEKKMIKKHFFIFKLLDIFFILFYKLINKSILFHFYNFKSLLNLNMKNFVFSIKSKQKKIKIKTILYFLKKINCNIILFYNFKLNVFISLFDTLKNRIFFFKRKKKNNLFKKRYLLSMQIRDILSRKKFEFLCKLKNFFFKNQQKISNQVLKMFFFFDREILCFNLEKLFIFFLSCNIYKKIINFYFFFIIYYLLNKNNKKYYSYEFFDYKLGEILKKINQTFLSFYQKAQGTIIITEKKLDFLEGISDKQNLFDFGLHLKFNKIGFNYIKFLVRRKKKEKFKSLHFFIKYFFIKGHKKNLILKVKKKKIYKNLVRQYYFSNISDVSSFLINNKFLDSIDQTESLDYLKYNYKRQKKTKHDIVYTKYFLLKINTYELLKRIFDLSLFLYVRNRRLLSYKKKKLLNKNINLKGKIYEEDIQKQIKISYYDTKLKRITKMRQKFILLRCLIYNKRVSKVSKLLEQNKQGLLLNLISIKNFISNLIFYLLNSKTKYNFIKFKHYEMFDNEQIKNSTIKDPFLLTWNTLDDFIFFSSKKKPFMSRMQSKIFEIFMRNLDNLLFLKERDVKKFNTLENFFVGLKNLQFSFIAVYIVKNLYEYLIINEIENDLELLELDAKKKRKHKYNIYFRLYGFITFIVYKTSSRLLRKDTQLLYQSMSSQHDIGYIDFTIYRVSDYNLLNYIYLCNINNTFNSKLKFSALDALDLNYFEKLEKSIFFFDCLKYRFFPTFKQYYNTDKIVEKLISLKYNMKEMEHSPKFYFLILNAVKGFNYQFLLNIFHIQRRYFKNLRLNFYLKFFLSVFNVDFFFYKLYKYVLFIFKNSLIKVMHKDYIVNKTTSREKTINSFFYNLLDFYATSSVTNNFWFHMRFVNFRNILKKKPLIFYKLYLYYSHINLNEYFFFKIFKQGHIMQNKDKYTEQYNRFNKEKKKKKRLTYTIYTLKFKKKPLAFLRWKFGVLNKSRLRKVLG